MSKEEFIQSAFISNVQGFLEASGLKGEVIMMLDSMPFVDKALEIAEKMWDKYSEKYGERA